MKGEMYGNLIYFIMQEIKMNICIIPSAELSYESGSTIYAHRLIKYINERGHKVFVICSKLPRKKVQDVNYRLLDIMEHPVIDDYYVTNEKMWDSVYKILREIIIIDNENKIDIIHAHYGTINSMVALNAKILLKIPYVVSCFGRDVFNGRSNDKRYARMLELSLPHSDYIVCANNEIKATLIDNKIINGNNKCIVLQMPIDTYLFSENEKFQVNGEVNFHILSVVSCFAEEKGILVTLKSLLELKKRGYNIFLSIIGCDEHPKQKNMNTYMKFINDNGMQEYVKFVGQISNEEIAGWLQKTDLFVDSRLGGNFSSVILEALFSKTLVIASDVKGNTEFIKDGINGRLYPTGNYIVLSDIIERFIKHEENIDKYKMGIVDWIAQNEKKYSFKVHVDCLEEIFANVVNNKKTFYLSDSEVQTNDRKGD